MLMLMADLVFARNSAIMLAPFTVHGLLSRTICNAHK